jgi:hypothetical protein
MVFLSSSSRLLDAVERFVWRSQQAPEAATGRNSVYTNRTGTGGSQSKHERISAHPRIRPMPNHKFAEQL